jgi:1,4-dihydroxy-2-naphthoate octaprenyltransferase
MNKKQMLNEMCNVVSNYSIKDIPRIWKGFWQVAAPMSWIASTIPMILGAVISYKFTGEYSWFWFLIALAGIYLIEIGKNSTNKLVDFILGVDGSSLTSDDNVHNLFTGESKTAITSGQLTKMEIGIISILTLLLGAGIGLFIVLFREPRVLLIGLIGLIIAVFYSVPPIKLSYRGLGEVSVGFAFGPIVMSGIYLVMSNSWDYRILLISLPISFFISNVLIVNEIPDYDEDTEGEKRNLIVIFGIDRGIKIYEIIFNLGFLSLVILAIIFKNPLWILGLIAVPTSRRCVNVAKVNYKDPKKFMEANEKTIVVYMIVGITMIVPILFL